MKITSEVKFHFVHDGSEEFDLSSKPVEISEEVYKHLIDTYGKEIFKIVGKEKPLDEVVEINK